MTMMKREVNNIWSRVRDDLDVDDLIFGRENSNNQEQTETCSDR